MVEKYNFNLCYGFLVELCQHDLHHFSLAEIINYRFIDSNHLSIFILSRSGIQVLPPCQGKCVVDPQRLHHTISLSLMMLM